MTAARSWPTTIRSAALRAAAVAALVFGAIAFAIPSVQAGTGSISGVAFSDEDRDGTLDSGETPFSGHRIYLFSETGQYLGQSVTDSTGRYAFSGLDSATYRVEYDAVSWSPIELSLVPTTTGSVWPRHVIAVSGNETADFGWRPIVWSTDPNAPVASYVAPNGSRVQTYNDAVAPEDVYAVVAKGTIGAEARLVTIRLGLGTTTTTTTSVVNVGGVYQDFHATASISYSAWLETKDYSIGHEYGHAWSWYYTYIVQQDEGFSAYLAARGLSGDPRVGSSYGWSAAEMIAEDYRQLLGPDGGRSRPQANRDIPLAADVPGLATFLRDTFTNPITAPPVETTPTPTPSPTPIAPVPTDTAPAILGLTVLPSPVKRSADFTFLLTTSANVTVTVLDGTGHVVKLLLSQTSKAAGPVDVVWDRTNAGGRRVRSGEYSVKVRAEDALGRWDAELATFLVA